VLVIKPHNKTPCELIRRRTPLIDFMKPFGCLVTILNIKVHLDKFDGKADEGFFLLGQQLRSDIHLIYLPHSINYSLKILRSVSGALDKDGKDDQATRSEFERLLQQEKQTVHPNNTNSINTVSTPVSTAGPSFTNNDPSSPVSAPKASNAFKEHLFERFSPFKNGISPS
ncbi:hypothetical protein Tco_0214290, partial [Tanacetum coccineum]